MEDQTDDIIKIDPVGFNSGGFNDLTIESEDVDDARALIQDILDALTGPTEITVDEGDTDDVVDDLVAMVDASKFFTNPIADFKALLAPYEVFTAVEDGETVGVFRWTDLNLDEWTLPDPTFNGILPEMITMADLLAEGLGFDEFFFEFSLTGGEYALISRAGIDCEADLAAGGTGCVTPGGGELRFSWIDLGHNDGEPEAWVNRYFENAGNFDYLGTYDVVDNLDGTYTVTMDLVRQFSPFTPVTWTALFTDNPGFTHTDEFGRDRGGSTIVLFGSEWTYEKQH